MKKIKNSPTKIEPSPDQSGNSSRSKKNKTNHLRSEAVDKKRKKSHTESFNQDIIESSQPSEIPKKKSRLDNRSSAIHIVDKIMETSSCESSPNVSKSCIQSGDHINKTPKMKEKKKRRTSFVIDNESDVTEHEDSRDYIDIREFSQLPASPKRKTQLDNRSSEIHIVGQIPEAASSGERQFEESSPNASESRIQSGDHINKRLKKKEKKKRRTSFFIDNESDVTENEDPNYQTHVEPHHTNLDKDRKESKSKVKRKSSMDIAFTDFVVPVAKQRADDAKMLYDNPEVAVTKKSKKSLENSGLSDSSANVPINDLETEIRLLKKERKHKAKEKVEKKILSTLLTMIDDCTSSSDDEIKKIHNCSEETLDKGNLRKHKKSRVSEPSLISDEAGYSLNTKHNGDFISLSKSDTTSDDYLLENKRNGKKCCNDNGQSFKLPEVIKSKKSDVDTVSDCSSSNISTNVKTEDDVLKKDRKRKANEKLRKKISNILLAMSRDSTSSSDDETNKIDNISEESLNSKNARKHNKSGVRQILTSNGEEKCHSSNAKCVRKLISSPKCDKTLDDDRTMTTDQDDQQSFEFAKAIEFEKIPVDTDANSGLPNISFQDEYPELGDTRKDSKHKAKGKVKKKSNTLRTMIHDSSSSSDLDNEMNVDNSEGILNKGNQRKHNESRVSQTLLTSDEENESRSAYANCVKKSISLSKIDKISDSHRSGSPENDKKLPHDNQQNSEFAERLKFEKLSPETRSNCSSPNISVKNVKRKLDVIRKNRKNKAIEKVEEKESNFLLAMIRDSSSSSDSDNKFKKINDNSEKYLNKGNLRKRDKSRVNQTLLTSEEEGESHSSDSKIVENSISLSNCEKTLDDHRSKSQENDKECSQDNKLNLPNISVTDEKTEPTVIRKSKKIKAKEKVERKKSNTLLAMIHDSSSSSDSDDGSKEIDAGAEESMNKVNLRKRTKSRVSETVTTSNDEEEDEEFDLDTEAKDLEELISAIEEEEQVPEETLRKLYKLRIKLKNPVAPQHQVESCAGSRGPTAEQKKIFEKYGPIKYGKFAPEEDDIIVNNWKSFCKLHNWDPRDVKPFLYMRHQHAGLITKFAERQKFVQFLADGLPWRLLYSVYWRFRNLYRPHIQTRYTSKEDKIIIAHMENSSAINTKNVRKFSELAKILNRTRASVWRRYRLLNQKRYPNKKIEWSLHLVKKIIKNLLQLTMSEDVSQLKDLDIPLVVWKKLSEKFEIETDSLKKFWLGKLHMQLFCKEPVYLNDVKIKLIEYFYVTGITEFWEIEWPNVAKHFDGMTSTFLCKIFGDLVHDKKYEGMDFSEILEDLYEVKKPELQKAPKDKCLARIVFEDGNVKLLDNKRNNRSKLKRGG